MIKLMEMVKYRHIRPYTKVEMNRITDEYLNNNKYKEVMPGFAKDKDDLIFVKEPGPKVIAIISIFSFLFWFITPLTNDDIDLLISSEFVSLKLQS